MKRCKLLIILNFILIQNCFAKIIEKVTYQFSKDPIDIVILCHKKDVRTLDLVIDGIQKNIDHRNIIIISNEPFTDRAKWFDEAAFPFTKKTVALEIFNDEQQAEAFLAHPETRIGWIYQQLCKLYALFVIPNVSENILIVDADTIFQYPVTFIHKDGAPLFNMCKGHHDVYFDHIRRLIPNLRLLFTGVSGITHHMLFQKCIMQDLFSIIREIHNEEPWKAICHTLDHASIYKSSVSEYELYFNFAFMRTDQVEMRFLKWNNVPFRAYHLRHSCLDYVSCHTFLDK